MPRTPERRQPRMPERRLHGRSARVPRALKKEKTEATIIVIVRHEAMPEIAGAGAAVPDGDAVVQALPSATRHNVVSASSH